MEQLFQSMPDIIQGLLGLVNMLVDATQGNLLDMHIELAGQTGVGQFLSEHVIKLNNKLKEVGISSADTLMGAAKALGAIFALVVAAQKAYKMMALDGKFEVLDIMRPILFALVIANSGAIVKMVTAPGEALENHFYEVYKEKCVTVENLRAQRSSFAGAFRNMISEKTHAAEEVEKSFTEQVIDGAVDVWNKVTNIGTTISSLAAAKVFGWVDEIMVFIGEIFFQIAVYFIFFIRALFLTVLTLFGPIQLACSILPVWKDSWATWIGRLVSVSLYGAMAYLVMIYSLYLLQFAYEVDCDKINAITTGAVSGGIGTWWDYVTGLVGSACMVFVAYLCGTLAMGTVPEMASWCIPGGSASMGASQFIGGMISRAEKGAKSGPGRM